MHMKYVLNGVEHGECFDTDAEFDRFYDGLKKGDMPTTVALNPFEFTEHFENIMKTTTGKDIIHVTLSSQLSKTHENAVMAAGEFNEKLEKNGDARRVHIVDSLTATLAIGDQVENFVKLRDSGADVKTALERVAEISAHQHGWVIMTDLFHLKRGGRIKPTAAIIGALLNIRPIIHVSKRGKLAIESKQHGSTKAVKYLLTNMEKYGEKVVGAEFKRGEMLVACTSKSELFDFLYDNVRSAYPEMKIRKGMVGPVIGSHLGCGAVAILFHGAPRLDID
jgi:DegV family protein with EDD domain